MTASCARASTNRLPATIRLRSIRLDETDAAAAVHRRGMATMVGSGGSRHSAEEDRVFYRDTVFRDCHMLGAFADATLLGHVAWANGWIEHLHVDPDHQRSGIGTCLVEGVKARLDDIQLWTFQANEPARLFYERQGFRPRQFTDGEANDEQRPDVRYRWRRDRAVVGPSS